MDDLELERLVIAASVPGHERVTHTRHSLLRRVGSTLFRVGVHLVYVVSSVLGDDVISRGVRRAVLTLAGVSMDSEAMLLGGTYLSKPSNLTLGFHTTINRDCYLDLEAPITFGDYSGSGHGSTFITTIHDIVPAMNLGVGRTAEPITIEERAWIGANVTILPGVTVGHDAIVAAGTVVVRDVPANSLVAGVPGRIVKHNVRHWLDEIGREREEETIREHDFEEHFDPNRQASATDYSADSSE